MNADRTIKRLSRRRFAGAASEAVTRSLATRRRTPTASRGSRRTAGRVRLSSCLVALLILQGATYAQPPDPAAVGRDRPLTSSWLCENERSVLLNAHPRRPAEEAWLTYAGTRVAVARDRRAPDVTYGSSDNRVRWTERGNEAELAFESLLERPIQCRRHDPSPR